MEQFHVPQSYPAVCLPVTENPNSQEVERYRIASYTYQSSSRFLAHGVLRRKVRLDLMVGSNMKQRIGIWLLISCQPCRSTTVRSTVSRVTPCKGSFGWDDGDDMGRGKLAAVHAHVETGSRGGAVVMRWYGITAVFG